VRATLIFSLLLVFAALAPAGPLACMSEVPSIPGFNLSSTSGAVGDFTLVCTGGTPGSTVPVNFDFVTNFAVINSGSWNLTDGVHNYSGSRVSPGEINFQNVPFNPPGSDLLVWSLDNVFVNPSLYLPGYQFTETLSTSVAIPITGNSVTVGFNQPSQTLNDFQGGPSSAPVPLPAGPPVGLVTGTIGGSDSQEFYSFYWTGGDFGASASVTGASNDASYLFSGGAAGSCNSLVSAPLNSGDGFTNTIGIANLAAGQFCIGIQSGSATDPYFALSFDTPVAGQVPEPSGFVLLSAGLAAMCVFRRRKRSQ
jgi:hypothetical protein